MKTIEVDDALYRYIAGQTQYIGENASQILRRLLNLPAPTAEDLQPEKGESAVKNHGVFAAKPQPVELPFGEPQKVDVNTKSQTATPTSYLQSASPSQTVPKTEAKPPRKQSEQAVGQLAAKVRALLRSDEFQQEGKAVGRFLALLRILYRTNPESFAQATENLQGRTRIYFARDEGTLLLAGNHTKPKQIPDTPYWVITNTNSARKMLMLEAAMQAMYLPEDLIDDVRRYFTAN